MCTFTFIGIFMQPRTGTFKSLWRLLYGQRLRYTFALGAILVSTVVVFIIPLVFRVAIDYAIDDKPLVVPDGVRHWVEAMGPRAYWAQNLWIAAVLTVALTCVAGLVMYLHGRWSSIASERVAQSLRDRLYDHIQRLPASYHDSAETGDLIQRSTSDVETLRMFLATQVTEIGRVVIMVGVAMAFMFPISWKMTLVGLATIPVILAFSWVFYHRIRDRFRENAEAESAMTSTLQENLTGIHVVRAFARQDYECETFTRKSLCYRDRWFGLVKSMSIYWSLSDMLCTAQKALVLGYGAYLIGHDPSFTIGDLVAFMVYVNMAIWPIQTFGRVLAEAGKAVVSMGRIEEVLDQEQEVSIVSEPLEPKASRVAGRIEFANVSFSHDGKGHALRDVSFTIEPGKTLALLGPSGSGKSTIAHLLLRLYDAQTGSIFLDGQDVCRLPREYVREQIGSVLQEPFLFSRSLRDNIKIGKRSAPDADMHAVVEASNLRESVDRFDAGYDTLIGERGVTLSGGQRQRVALARAILKDPPILLLDDALSAVDTRTEAMILSALKNRSHRHTTLVIAHRISTLKNADEIVVLDHGSITQCGTHEELIDRPGLYRRLWQSQYDLEADLQRELSEADDASFQSGGES